MYLKRIELHGFKSFADKSVIEFQPGITGIVGPNGCGKSNISDAVRWVLGEQSVKSLRGSNMSDVIFNGSEDRKAQNVAEVTLVFDNEDRFMNVDYNEVELTRRLYRQNNEAEYLINKEPCRLKDIIDLIMDTGLGRDSLSIISQGNISTFADSKPEERRGMFEEAAGVAKYKKRKLESIRKLERTKDNLDRVEDICLELEKQLSPLKRQKEKAEIYVDLKNQLQSVEVSVLVKGIESLSASLKDLNQSLDLLDKENEVFDSINDINKLKDIYDAFKSDDSNSVYDTIRTFSFCSDYFKDDIELNKHLVYIPDGGETGIGLGIYFLDDYYDNLEKEDNIEPFDTYHYLFFYYGKFDNGKRTGSFEVANILGPMSDFSIEFNYYTVDLVNDAVNGEAVCQTIKKSNLIEYRNTETIIGNYYYDGGKLNGTFTYDIYQGENYYCTIEGSATYGRINRIVNELTSDEPDKYVIALGFVDDENYYYRYYDNESGYSDSNPPKEILP